LLVKNSASRCRDHDARSPAANTGRLRIVNAILIRLSVRQPRAAGSCVHAIPAPQRDEFALSRPKYIDLMHDANVRQRSGAREIGMQTSNLTGGINPSP